MTPPGLDQLDHDILEALRLDGRRSIRDLAKELDVPETTVRDHIHRMEESGAIQAHRPILEPAALGITEAAWVFARCAEDDRLDITSKLALHPQVVAVRRFATDPEHFAVRIVGGKHHSIAQVIESSLLHHDFRVKTVLPIDRTPLPNANEDVFWPSEHPIASGSTSL